MMKKVFMTTMLLTLMTATWAYDYPYLMVETADGEVKILSVESLVLTFGDGKLTAVNAEGTQALVLTDLSKMYFSSTPSGIGTADTTSEERQAVDIYSVNGVKMGTFESVTQAQQELVNGIYIVKSKNKNYKITIK